MKYGIGFHSGASKNVLEGGIPIEIEFEITVPLRGNLIEAVVRRY
jgi:hypothetical protein